MKWQESMLVYIESCYLICVNYVNDKWINKSKGGSRIENWLLHKW